MIKFKDLIEREDGDSGYLLLPLSVVDKDKIEMGEYLPKNVSMYEINEELLSMGYTLFGLYKESYIKTQYDTVEVEESDYESETTKYKDSLYEIRVYDFKGNEPVSWVIGSKRDLKITYWGNEEV